MVVVLLLAMVEQQPHTSQVKATPAVRMVLQVTHTHTPAVVVLGQLVELLLCLTSPVLGAQVLHHQ
jgi:hypothetical protein